MSNYNWEEFKSEGNRSDLTISLGESDRFYFGSFFCTKYKVLSKAGVKLLYDKEKNAVGFKFLNKEEEGMVRIKNLDKRSGYINAKPFLLIYEINSKKYAQRYHPTEITDAQGEKIFVVELKENTPNK